MYEIFVGNVCSLCAMASDSVSAAQKKNERVLGVQIISQFFYIAGSIILKGYSSTVQNVVSIVRNVAAIKKIKSKVLEAALIALGVILGAIFNNRGLLGLLPVVANLEYSIATFRFRDSEKGLKAAFLVNALMYSVFNVVIINYVGVVANAVVAVTTAIALLRKPKKEEDKKEVEN